MDHLMVTHASKRLVSQQPGPIQGKVKGMVLERETYCGLILIDVVGDPEGPRVYGVAFGWRASCIECLVRSHDIWYPAIEVLYDMAKVGKSAAGVDAMLTFQAATGNFPARTQSLLDEWREVVHGI